MAPNLRQSKLHFSQLTYPTSLCATGQVPRATSCAILKHNAEAKSWCAQIAGFRATCQMCAAANFAVSAVDNPNWQPAWASQNNVCTFSQTKSTLYNKGLSRTVNQLKKYKIDKFLHVYSKGLFMTVNWTRCSFAFFFALFFIFILYGK